MNEEVTNLEKGVVVHEAVSTEMVENKEAKKAKMVSIGKKVGLIGGAIGLTALGFILGRKTGRNDEYDDSEIDDEEVIDSDEYDDEE